LGTGRIANFNIKFLNFEKARKFVRSLNLKTHGDWIAFTKSGNLPSDIPAYPNGVYKNKGWKGMRDWLGTNADE
jgi:hypothetical protein